MDTLIENSPISKLRQYVQEQGGNAEGINDVLFDLSDRTLTDSQKRFQMYASLAILTGVVSILQLSLHNRLSSLLDVAYSIHLLTIIFLVVCCFIAWAWESSRVSV